MLLDFEATLIMFIPGESHNDPSPVFNASVKVVPHEYFGVHVKAEHWISVLICNLAGLQLDPNRYLLKSMFWESTGLAKSVACSLVQIR